MNKAEIKMTLVSNLTFLYSLLPKLLSSSKITTKRGKHFSTKNKQWSFSAKSVVLNLWFYNNTLEHTSKIQIPRPHCQAFGFSRSRLGPKRRSLPESQKLEQKKIAQNLNDQNHHHVSFNSIVPGTTPSNLYVLYHFSSHKQLNILSTLTSN